MKRFLILIAIAFLTSSCSKRMLPPESIQKDSTLSVSIVEKLKDSTVLLPADSSSIVAELAHDSSGNITIRQIVSYKQGKDLAIPRLSIRKNTLTVQTNLSERKLLLYYKEKFKETLMQKSLTVTKPVFINRLYWYQKVLNYMGLAFLIYICILTIKLFIKK